MLLANFVVLEVVVKHKHNPHDLLPAEEVEDLGDFLDNSH
jgi:hypothetical protein